MNQKVCIKTNRVRAAFSKSALRYDAVADLQKQIGQQLIARVSAPRPGARILDIGMGTGFTTDRLARRFPEAHVTGLDFSESMVARARRFNTFEAMLADVDPLPFDAGVFDGVFSNLAFQWMDDLPSVFCECSRVLKDGGELVVALFGYRTFPELFDALKATARKPDKSRVAAMQRLPKINDVREALRAAHFQNMELTHEDQTLSFADLMALLRWNKALGSNALRKEFFFGKQWLSALQNFYHRYFSNGQGGVFASAEVIWIKAKK